MKVQHNVLDSHDPVRKRKKKSAEVYFRDFEYKVDSC